MFFRRRVIGSINIKDIAVVTCVSKVYNGQTQVATNITVTFKGETLTQGVDYTIIENAGGTNVGSYTVKVKGIKKYSGEAQGTFSITKVTPTVTAPTPTNPTYNGSSQALIVAGSTDFGTLQYSLDDSTYSTAIPSGTNATSYTVYYKVEGDSNINGVPAQSVNVSIAKANQAAPIATGATTTYNTTATATASGGGGQGSLEWESAQSQTSVGSHTTRARWGGNSNYNASPWSSSVTVQMNKAAGSVTINGVSLTCNGSSRNLVTVSNATGTMHYKVDSGSWSTSIPTATNSGSWTIYWYMDASTNYEGISSASTRYVSSSISKNSQSAPTATGATTTYNTTATATASGGGGQGSIEWSNGNTQTSVGSKTTKARWSGNACYNASSWSNEVTLTMNKASQSAPTATGATVDYGSTATATASGGGGQGSIEWSNGNTRTAIGSQSTSARWSGNGNYNASSWSNSVTLEVRPAHAGHDYVEIAGIKWATMNIGANSITDTGLYFQWADTQGYTASQVGSGSGQKYFGWADYKYGNGASSPGATGMTKYNSTDGKTVLDLSDDAARANWGGNWRMPTTAEFQALGNAVNTAFTANYQGSGVAGFVCTDKTDSSKVLFFPAAGDSTSGGVLNVGSSGLYWSSSLRTSDIQNAYFSYFRSSYTNWGTNMFRYLGFSVRGVVGQ